MPLTEAPGVCKPCPPNILMQHNPDMVVIDVHSVFLAGMRTDTQRESVFGEKRVYSWPSCAFTEDESDTANI